MSPFLKLLYEKLKGYFATTFVLTAVSSAETRLHVIVSLIYTCFRPLQKKKNSSISQPLPLCGAAVP